MSTSAPNRVQPGVTEGGQFATKARSESPTILSAGRTAVSERIDKHLRLNADLISKAERRLAVDREIEIQLRLAEVVEYLPAQAHSIELNRRYEEVNDYGSYDITLGEVYDAQGNEIDHAGDDMTISLRGGEDSPSNWGEPFGVDSESPAIPVEAVRQWSRTLA